MRIMLQSLRSIVHSPCRGAATLFAAIAFVSAGSGYVADTTAHAHPAPFQETEFIKVGERLTYAVTVGGLGNAGFADLSVVSRGRFQERDAFEVRLKMKTFDTVNAAFFPLDEIRTTYLDAASGLPFAVRRVADPDGFAIETVQEFSPAPSGLDLSALIFKVRLAGGSGKFRLSDGQSNFWVVMKARDGGSVSTEVGVFDATESSVSSAYFKSVGISEMKVFLSKDDARIPAMITFKTRAGLVSARLTGYTPASSAGDKQTQAQPSATPSQPARPGRPRPTPTKPPYVDNRPLGEDLPFALGEKLSYRIKNGESQIGKMIFEASERKQVDGRDSLLISASVTDAVPNAGLFAKGDYTKAVVNPSSILPQSSETRFRGGMTVLNESTRFDQEAGTAMSSGSQTVAIPSSTHALLSLLYAIRTFNLKPSKTAGNPVNDTRVSVFWNNQSLVFTFRPAGLQTITVDGAKIGAQQVNVVTGSPQIDAMDLRVWISTDPERRPLRISFGAFSAELILSESK